MLTGAFIIIKNTPVIVESEEISDQNVAATIFRTTHYSKVKTKQEKP